jgi:glycosyltransferase involved in cell wall biosynthesis
MSSPEARVGIVTWDFASARGGLGRSMRWLAAGLRERGVSVSVASPHPEETMPALLYLTSRMGGHLLFSLLLPFTLQLWIDRHRITTLLVPVGPGGVLLLRKPKRCRVVAWSHHTYWQQSRLVPGEAWKWALAATERRTLAVADQIVVAANDTRTSLEEEYGVAPECIRHLVPVFPADHWAPEVPKVPGLCVYVGRLDRRKGASTLLRAWPEVVDRHPHAKLVLVGKGKGVVEVFELLRANSSVSYHEDLSNTELRSLMGSAQVALCPSYLEGFGLFAAEAMAAGCAVLCSDAEGLRNLIRHEETGLLLPSGDGAAWAAGINAVLSDDALRERLALSARGEAYARFDRGTALAEWVTVLMANTQHSIINS